jgi:hypothetical protein
MLAIGVAEPELGGAADTQADQRMRQDANDTIIGLRLWNAWSYMTQATRWLFSGFSQRILVGFSLFAERLTLTSTEGFSAIRGRPDIPASPV